MKAKFLVVWVLMSLWPTAVLAQSDELNEAFTRAKSLIQQGRHSEAEPYANEALKLGMEEFGPNNPATATIMGVLAGLYRAQGRYVESEKLYQRSLKIFEGSFSKEHPGVATNLNDLANVYRDQGRYEEAEPLIKRARNIYEKALGPEHPHFAISIGNLAKLYKAQGRYGEAEPLYERALNIIEKAHGAEHRDVATSLNDLAGLYRDQGRYKEAEPLYERALDIYEKVLGPQHPFVATSLDDLAWLYKNQGRYDEAELLIKRALVIRESALGPEHQQVGISLQNLASIYVDQGRHSEAEPPVRRALGIYENFFGPEHPSVASGLYLLASIYRIQGLYEEAERILKRVLSIGEKAFGPNHPYLGTSLDSLAMLHSDQGRYEDAESLMRRALRIREKTLGPEHPAVGISLNNLAMLYRQQGRYKEAEPIMRRARNIYEKVLGPDHPDVAVNLSNLALLYSNQGRYEEAKPLYERALGITEKVLGPDHPDMAGGLHNLAGVYSNQGRYGEAEPLYKRALDIVEKVYGAEHPRVASSLNDLAFLYERLGRYADSELLYERTIGIREKILGPEHPDLAVTLNNLAGLYSSTGRNQEAVELARRATVIHTRRRVHPTGQLLAGAESEQRSVRYVFLRHLDFAFVLANEDPGLRDALVEESFEVAQLARISVASKAIAGMSARFAAGNDELARVARERQDTISRLQWLDNQLVSALSRTSEERDDKLEGSVRTEVDLLGERLTALNERLASDFPGYAEISDPQPVPLSEVQGLLGREEALISFAVWDEFSFMLVVRDDRAEMFKVEFGANALRTAVKLLRLYLAPQGRTEISDLLDRDYPGEKAFELYQKLIAPAEPLLAGVRHLFVVPDGELQSLPLGVLLTEEPQGDFNDFDAYRRASWLARKYAITTLPSVSSLRALRRYAKSSTAAKPFIGFGDPVLASGADNNRGIEISSVFRGHVADLEAIRQLPSLPETADELKDIARTLGADESVIFLGTNATEAQVRVAPLAESRVLAFATHALVGGEIEGAAEPALVLTPPKVATDDDDGLLTASEIAKHLTLNADWVILSACNTAAGETPDAEGLSGLAKAFFYAGSRALLVSHWPVPSESAVKLTTGTFAALAADPEIGRAEALQRSMLALLEDTETDYFAHPFFWAPFVVVGEGGRVGHP